MELTRDQFEAARASGCVFLPATEAQVQRLTMQRRIFRMGGEPFVATRDGGGFLETYGTLSLLIERSVAGQQTTAGETVQEAAAADAEAAAEIAVEGSATGHGGAQVVGRRRAAGRPRAPWRGAKRGTAV